MTGDIAFCLERRSVAAMEIKGILEEVVWMTFGLVALITAASPLIAHYLQ